MLPLLAAITFLVMYVVVYMRGRHVWQLQARHRAFSVDMPRKKSLHAAEASDEGEMRGLRIGHCM